MKETNKEECLCKCGACQDNYHCGNTKCGSQNIQSDFLPPSSKIEVDNHLTIKNASVDNDSPDFTELDRKVEEEFGEIEIGAIKGVTHIRYRTTHEAIKQFLHSAIVEDRARIKNGLLKFSAKIPKEVLYQAIKIIKNER